MTRSDSSGMVRCDLAVHVYESSWLLLATRCSQVGACAAPFFLCPFIPRDGQLPSSDGICFSGHDVSDNAPVQLQCVGAVCVCVPGRLRPRMSSSEKVKMLRSGPVRRERPRLTELQFGKSEGVVEERLRAFAWPVVLVT